MHPFDFCFYKVFASVRVARLVVFVGSLKFPRFYAILIFPITSSKKYNYFDKLQGVLIFMQVGLAVLKILTTFSISDI
jgi:hypothetical protein